MTPAAAGMHYVSSASTLARVGKIVVEIDEKDILILWNNGSPVAMDDKCIHRGRSLSDGVLLNGRIVCAGHQWAFDLTNGYCRARGRYQPVHYVVVDGDSVHVILSQQPAGPTSELICRTIEMG